MAWDSFDIGLAEPLVADGTQLLGLMVRRRRLRFGLSQRRLALLAGFDQSVISRLENGLLRGMRYRRFAILVAILGGLDEHGPPPRWWLERHHQRLPWDAARRASADPDLEGDADQDADAGQEAGLQRDAGRARRSRVMHLTRIAGVDGHPSDG